MSEYLDIVKKSECSGCMACVNICPVNAIKINEDSDSFVYPYVDKNLCTNCGLCNKACPIIKTGFNNKQDFCYAATADDETLAKSSSGGVFSVIAEQILEENGVVCGVQFNKDWNPEHIIVDNKDDLRKLRGSKYVQSDVGFVYKEIKSILKTGRKVLFSGTPCQVAGLYGVLGCKPDNLLTIDIVCHGVPSQKIWQTYLNENFDKEKIQFINFRDKERGWKSILTVVVVSDGIKTFNSPYMDGFVKNVYLRESCGDCKFAKTERVADITLADFWGIWKEDPKMYNPMGVSLVITNSENGEHFFEKIKDRCSTLQKEEIEKTVMNYPLFRSSIHHENRNYFIQKFCETGIFNKTLNDTLKPVSIINFWWCNNYGAMCTAYALQEMIKELGYVAKTVNYIPKWFYKLRYKGGISEKFAEKHFNLTELAHSKKELEKLNDVCSTFICGSDQIWRYGVEQLRNWKYFKDYENLCFLSYANNTKKKIAYAASFACDNYEGPHRNRSFVRYLLNRFQYISVREEDGVDICKKEFGVNATHVLDPVFLQSQNFWSNLADKAELSSKNHICYYVLDTPSAKKHTLDYIKDKVGGELIDISKGFNEPLENWLYYIKNCKLFVADSFHGCCLAIIFNKPFICFKNTFRGGSRFDSIFGLLGLKNRILMDYERIEDRPDLFDSINYDEINKKLEIEKQKSINWLKTALDDGSEIKITPQEDMLEAVFNLLEESINSKDLPVSGIDSINKLRTELVEIHFQNINNSFNENDKKIRSLYILNNIQKFKFKKTFYKFKSLIYSGEKKLKYKNKYQNLKKDIKEAQILSNVLKG